MPAGDWKGGGGKPSFLPSHPQSFIIWKRKGQRKVCKELNAVQCMSSWSLCRYKVENRTQDNRNSLVNPVMKCNQVLPLGILQWKVNALYTNLLLQLNESH